jgi:hypothetical protein
MYVVGNFKEDFMKTKSLLFGMAVLLAASLIFMGCPEPEEDTPAIVEKTSGAATAAAGDDQLTITITGGALKSTTLNLWVDDATKKALVLTAASTLADHTKVTGFTPAAVTSGTAFGIGAVVASGATAGQINAGADLTVKVAVDAQQTQVGTVGATFSTQPTIGFANAITTPIELIPVSGSTAKQVKYSTAVDTSAKTITITLVDGKLTAEKAANADASDIVTPADLKDWTAEYSAASAGATDITVTFSGSAATGSLTEVGINKTALAALVTADLTDAQTLKLALGANAAVTSLAEVTLSGDVTVSTAISVPLGVALTVPTGKMLTVESTLTVNGTGTIAGTAIFENTSQIDGTGTINVTSTGKITNNYDGTVGTSLYATTFSGKIVLVPGSRLQVAGSSRNLFGADIAANDSDTTALPRVSLHGDATVEISYGLLNFKSSSGSIKIGQDFTVSGGETLHVFGTLTIADAKSIRLSPRSALVVETTGSVKGASAAAAYITGSNWNAGTVDATISGLGTSGEYDAQSTLTGGAYLYTWSSTAWAASAGT